MAKPTISIKNQSLEDLEGHDNLAFVSRNSANLEESDEGTDYKNNILERHNNGLNFTKINADSERTNVDDIQDIHRLKRILQSKTKYEDSEAKSSPAFCPKLRFFPTYRKVSRIMALIFMGLFSWCILFAIVGSDAAPPDGRIFQLMVLFILAYLGGWLITLTGLPGLIGMLFMGLFLQNIKVVNIDSSFSGINKVLRSLALVNILVRAGLGLDPIVLRQLWATVLKLDLGTYCLEGIIVALLSASFLDLPWGYAILLGSVIAAVSPAVIVPSLFRLRAKGYGVAKGIPTLILAITGIDAMSVTVFTIIKSIIFSTSSLTMLIIQGPVSVIGGLLFGMLWGLICYFIPEKGDPYVVQIRILLLIFGGLASVFGSELIGFGGAGPLACVSAAFFSLVGWNKLGWNLKDNPAIVAFRIFWTAFEPILFGLTGASINFSQLDSNVVYISIGILIAAAIIRIGFTIILSIRCNLNLKEKIFVSIALMAKATMQAALGPVVLGIVEPGSKEAEFGEKILTTCVLSIILSAPIGAILITILGPRLLKKEESEITGNENNIRNDTANNSQARITQNSFELTKS